MRRLVPSMLLATLTLGGCAGRPEPVAVAPPPPVVAAAAVAAPQGYPGLTVPPRGADGGYVTPNVALSAAAAVWHLRAGLNVAALACRGPQEVALVAGYNRLLREQAASFAASYRMLGIEYGGVAAFDAGMTRLYNYYALPAAQAGLCAAAGEILAELALLPPGTFDQAAPAALARLDRPYQTVFAVQEAWLATRTVASTHALAALPQIAVDPAALLP